MSVSEGRALAPVGEILWQPPAGRIADSRLAAFAARFGLGPTDYAALHALSIGSPEAFYSALWDFVGVVGDRGGRATSPDGFFPEAQLNYAENLLRDPDDRPAIVALREDGTRRVLARRELLARVSQVTQALLAEGVCPGDRVAAIVTNDVEAAVLHLGCAAIGAIWASCSPDFGPAGAADRLTQIAPVLLVAVPSYRYGGKPFDIAASIAAVAAAESVRRVVIFGDETGEYGKPAVRLDDWLAPFAPGPIAWRREGFDAALSILFSSGTTGKPKCIVHRAGGLLLQHMKEQQLHCDIGPADRLLYYTTCGWMMWNWQLSALASGATLVTYDGSPGYPHTGRLLDLAAAERVTVFGTSAKYVDICAKHRVAPADPDGLAGLRTILSTGSALLPENFDYIYAHWKRDVHLASISGGTDICGCFLGGIPTLPVRRGELQGALLGMDVAAFDPDGRPLAGEPGELVCRRLHPSMPLGFWGDTDGSHYRAAYFERFPGIWTHGDYVEQRPSGGFIVHGRSDATLNPGGVRIGTAEIYRLVEAIPEVLEAVAVAQSWQGDQRIVLFVKLRDGHTLDTALVDKIKARIRAGATPRHVPARILAVPDIPRTRSGKISEIAVRDTIHGRAVANQTALANPESLAAFAGLPELQS